LDGYKHSVVQFTNNNVCTGVINLGKGY